MVRSLFFYVFVLMFFLIFELQIVSAAHYAVGIVNDARDGAIANGHTIVLWNPVYGISDNLTDEIGVNGNSQTSNVYMIDCEMLNNSCNIGDLLYLKVINNGDDHFSSNVSFTVMGSGFDIVPNITLSSIFNITTISVDDDLLSPPNEIDLISGSNRTVTCRAVINDLDGIGMKNATARFFDNFSSSYSDSDNGNIHYSNNSCFINSSYGINQSEVLCNFKVAYYANSSYWNCTIKVYDNNNVTANGSRQSFINTLLSIEVNDSVSFGITGNNIVSLEKTLNVTNYGNVKINLSLHGYAREDGDNYSMNCSSSKNISIMYLKYNLTESNPGNLTLLNFQANYTNLTGSSVTKKFNLDFRHSDSENIAMNSTFWRIYVPAGIYGGCSGKIVFGATQGSGS